MNGVAMNTFTIDTNHNITAFASLEQARAAKILNAEYFGSAQELAKLAASWPRTRPIEIWNSFAGVAPFTSLQPVKRFTNRKVAVARIWKAVQALLANVGKQAAQVGPAKAKRGKEAQQRKGRHTALIIVRIEDKEVILRPTQISAAPVSFASDILPLFTATDIAHMQPMGVLLSQYSYMSGSANDHQNATTVQAYLTGTQQPQMPLGGPFWSQQQLDLYAQWMSDGFQP